MQAAPVRAQPVPSVRPDQDRMYLHMRKARELAGTDLYAHYVHRCIVDQTYRRTISRGLQARNKIEAAKVFDNLYFVGENAVSSWALDTGDGIVLFDALYGPDDISNIVEPGLRKFGLDPRNIKYLVITHGHGDHFGGANYLKEKYGTRIMASTIDWEFMGTGPLVPARDLDIADGQTLTVGNVTLNFFITPGHTPGTVSTVFKTTDRGEPHVVGFFGGMGTPSAVADKKALIASAKRFEGIAQSFGIDAGIANHVTQDQAIPKLEELRLRRAGDPNPYVLGTSAYVRYLQVQQECTEFAMAQQGQR